MHNPKAIQKKGNNLERCEHEVRGLVNKILEVIENINEICDHSPKTAYPPIQIPPYPKKMEQGLKCPAWDESSLREFSSYLYMLMVDGHRQVMTEDRAIISKGHFLSFARPLLDSIRIFRCDLHHLNIKHTDKQKLGRLYYEVCGKNQLDDRISRQKFQMELLDRTFAVLKKERESVIKKINQIQQIRAVG